MMPPKKPRGTAHAVNVIVGQLTYGVPDFLLRLLVSEMGGSECSDEIMKAEPSWRDLIQEVMIGQDSKRRLGLSQRGAAKDRPRMGGDVTARTDAEISEETLRASTQPTVRQLERGLDPVTYFARLSVTSGWLAQLVKQVRQAGDSTMAKMTCRQADCQWQTIA